MITWLIILYCSPLFTIVKPVSYIEPMVGYPSMFCLLWRVFRSLRVLSEPWPHGSQLCSVIGPEVHHGKWHPVYDSSLWKPEWKINHAIAKRVTHASTKRDLLKLAWAKKNILAKPSMIIYFFLEEKHRFCRLKTWCSTWSSIWPWVSRAERARPGLRHGGQEMGVSQNGWFIRGNPIKVDDN